MPRRRLGPARGDRVNFPSHNRRAIVLPQQRVRTDPAARPAHGMKHIPFERAPEPSPEPLPGPIAPRYTCPGCRAEKLRMDRYGDLYSHLLRGTTASCPWNRYSLERPPPANWPVRTNGRP